MDKELIENIANALAVSEICPFAHEDCIDNCHKHFSNWLDNHDKQIREDAIDEFKNIWDKRVKDLINWCKDTRLIGLQQADYIFDEIAEQLKEQK